MNEILFAFIAFVDLQNQELKENLKYWKEKSQEDTQEVEKLSEQVDDCNVIIDRFLIIILKKDILDIINGAKDKNVLHKEKETK